MSVRVFDKREALATTYTSFCTDNEGFLWVGTDAGLIRMDGYDCDVYRYDDQTSESISDDKVVCLYCDSKGGVWVGTANGLNYYDRQTDSFKHINLPGLDFDGYIGQIFEDDQNRLTFLVGGVGLFSVPYSKDGKIVSDAQRLKLSLSDGDFFSHVIDLGNGNLFVTTLHGHYGIAKRNGKFEKLGKLNSNILRAHREKNGDILLSSQYEVRRLNMRDHTVSRLETEGGEKIKITSAETADDGSILFSTAWSGLWEVQPGSKSVRRSDRLVSSVLDFSKTEIGGVHSDKRGNLWLGCNNKGIVLLPARRTPFNTVALNQILKNSGDGKIICMNIVAGKILVGLNTGYLLMFDSEGNFLRSLQAPGHNFVNCIIPENQDNALVGLTKEGIWRFDVNKLVFTKVSSIDCPYAGVILAKASNGDVIAAVSEAGVLKLNTVNNEKKWYHAQEGSNILSTSYYAGICPVADGRIWIGGYSGLSCYDPQKGTLIPIDQTPFLDGVCHSICDADNGCVFIGTGRGLLKYHPQKGILKKFTTHDGLADNDVRSIVRDNKGGIWIGTLGGLSYMPNEGEPIKSYRREIGLSETSCVSSVCILNNNRIVLGGHEGISFFNPDSLATSSFGADIRISGMYLNGIPVSPSSKHGNSSYIIEGNQYCPDALHLSFRDKSLVLRLSTMDFRDASCVRYEWQLDGDGDNWNSTPLGEHFLYLPSLEPGTYILRLRGWENDVCSEISEIKLDITPPWYLSNMAYSAYAILGLVMLGLFYKVFKSKREEDLYEARIKYFMDISHEIRSPITLLINPIDALLKQKQSPETTAQLLTARRNAQRVLSLADQLLDLRKIEKGKMRLVYTPTDIRSFIEELVDMFRPQAEEKGQTIQFICPMTSLWGEVDRDNLDKILVNLISNAIKYTPEGGAVTVSLDLEHEGSGQDMYVVTVADTGIGLDNKLISHMFERFYRGRENHVAGTSGFGIGLDLCLRLVSLHSGKIEGANRSDGIKGSVFTVHLPLIPLGSGSSTDLPMGKKGSHLQYVPVVPLNENDIQKSKGSNQRLRVMVIDDDAELREYIRSNLGNGYKVVTVPDGETALKQIAEKNPDIIVTDVKMDGMDGFELLKRVKTNISTQHIPVIVLSSSSEVEDRTRGWKLGADGFLAKPFSIGELMMMVNGLIATRNKLKGTFSGKKDEVQTIAAPKLVGRDEELLKKMNQYINDNISEPSLSVDALSDHVGLSRSQFHRRLKDMLGLSPSDYIRNVRLQKACEMLRTTDTDISQIAYSLGFNAQSHFSTLFKKFVGVTPTEYRIRETSSSAVATSSDEA